MRVAPKEKEKGKVKQSAENYDVNYYIPSFAAIPEGGIISHPRDTEVPGCGAHRTRKIPFCWDLTPRGWEGQLN